MDTPSNFAAFSACFVVHWQIDKPVLVLCCDYFKHCHDVQFWEHPYEVTFQVPVRPTFCFLTAWSGGVCAWDGKLV